jgi:hypothetical protein
MPSPRFLHLAFLLAAVAVLTAAPARADALRYDRAWFSPSTSEEFTIQGRSSLLSPITAYPAAFNMSYSSGPTRAAANSSFMAWSGNIYHDLDAGAAYSLNAGGAHFSGTSYVVSDLNRLPPHRSDKKNLLTNNPPSAAFQLAVWEIDSDRSGMGFYSVGRGGFVDTAGDTTATATANELLSVAYRGHYASDRALGVWQANGTDANQNLALPSPVSPVPEPQTYGMLLAALAMMGFVAIRRQGARRNRT